MKKIQKIYSILALSILLVLEILCILFFGSTAINVGMTLIFPQSNVDISHKDIISLAYLPFLFLGISAGFIWLAFKTVKMIKNLQHSERIVSQDISIKYGSWKMISISLIIVVVFAYVIRANLGPE